MTASTLNVYAVWTIVALCCAASMYAIFAAVAMPRLGAPSVVQAAALASVPVSVSVLKPLCGAEPRLYENLATFCEQNHPRFQLLFGVSSPHDPAIKVVRKLQAAYAKLDIDLVIDGRVHGSNLKVSNLINLAGHARYDTLVVADSDIAVERDYLRIVTAPLDDSRVGVVTCLYRAHGINGVWSRLGALFINAWFAPSVRIAHAAGSRAFGFGATLALRRSTLEQIGGFEAIRDCLADDYMLAHHARDHGLQTVLAPILVTTDVVEGTPGELWLRETRWLRTIRSVNPPGSASLFITFTSLWLLLGVLIGLCPGVLSTATGAVLVPHPATFAVLDISTAAGFIARFVLHARSTAGWKGFCRDLPLIPLRDGLLLLQWIAAMFGSHVVWRGTRVRVANPACNATQVYRYGETP